MLKKTLSGSGTPPLSSTGFQLDSGKTVRLETVPGWSYRIWARTGCKFDQTGAAKCLTEDFGGRLQYGGSGATPPASLFEITLGQGSNKDFYDVSMVDGYNLPLVARPTRTNGAACNATGCISDLNMGCPKELQVMGGEGAEGGVIACKSACEAFGLAQYCCSGQFANPTTANNPIGGPATSPPIVPYNSPPSSTHSPPPIGGTAMSPPRIPYESPPTYSSQPIGGTTMPPPSISYTPPPSLTNNPPPIGQDTPPSFTGNSEPPFEKHSYGDQTFSTLGERNSELTSFARDMRQDKRVEGVIRGKMRAHKDFSKNTESMQKMEPGSSKTQMTQGRSA
uniref:Uncharacterized protein n=1 Tax=Chenopodium quinoa TaxID=63459 RepID=A0A803L261_CHEQI